jgi:hypothetical protein
VAAPLDPDVDFDLLARELKLAGGNLQNIALVAAFYAAGHLVNRADEESACPGRPTRKGIRISSGAETALMRIGGPDPAMPDHSPPGDPGIEPPVGQISVSENEQEPAAAEHGTIHLAHLARAAWREHQKLGRAWDGTHT